MTYTDLKHLLITHRQVLLTGAGGTGKSYTIKKLLTHFDSVVKLSSTNYSAMLIGGETLHSFFKINNAKSLAELDAIDNRYIEWYCGNFLNNVDRARKAQLRSLKSALFHADLIIIDEVSMISASVLDLIFYRIKQCKLKEIPPILFVGDFYQLPPIASDRKLNYIFDSENFKPKIIELTKIQRTLDLDLAIAQQHIRQRKYTKQAHDIIDKCINNNRHKESITITSLRNSAAEVNLKELQNIKHKSTIYKMQVVTNNTKNQTELDNLLNSIQARQSLEFKLNARVIFIATNKQQGYHNGLQGTIIDLKNDYIKVLCDNGQTLIVERASFFKHKLVSQNGINKYETLLEVKQFPLDLGYAITIHKSQGMSIDKLHIDCKGIFDSAQFYVAFSRATNKKYLSISKDFKRDFVRMENIKVNRFYEANVNNTHFIDSIKDNDLNFDKYADLDKYLHI